MPTALIYDPYIDTFGGGERYTLSVAEILLGLGWQVDLAWHNAADIQVAQERFNLKLDNLNLSPEYYRLFTQSKPTGLWQKFKSLSSLDLVFIVSDGSVPLLFGKKTILHYQVPFTKINRSQLINQLKLRSISHIVVNSRFTKSVIDHTLGIARSQVLYPPIAVDQFHPDTKQKLILSVGRFASPGHSKRQDILIQAFKFLYEQGYQDWQLALAGGQKGKDTILGELKKQARGYPIKFFVNAPFKTIQNLYSIASIYWHAAGYQVDESLNPESVEHFGMTTVEAMASGCVPVVVKKGGQPEIITDKSGFLFTSLEELIDHTQNLIDKPKLLNSCSKIAIDRAQAFSQQKFAQKLQQLIQ